MFSFLSLVKIDRGYRVLRLECLAFLQHLYEYTESFASQSASAFALKRQNRKFVLFGHEQNGEATLAFVN
jgi:hypothetical protein